MGQVFQPATCNSVMDKKSFHILEFDKVLERLTRYASFSAGEAVIRAVEPTIDLFEARRLQAETKEAIALLDSGSDITLGGARDVRPAVDNAIRGYTLPAGEFLDIRATIVAARTLRRQLERTQERYPHLAAIGELIEECPGVVTAISETLDDRGEVLDSASPKLANIRKALRVAYGRIQDKLQNLVNSSMNQYLQEAIITMRSGRYVVPLRAEHKGRISGIVHDQSGSGATLWIEPIATVELNNEYRSLQIQEEEEVQRILAELSRKVGGQGDVIKRIVERLAEMDLVLARAKYAVEIDGIEPQFVEWRTLSRPEPPKHPNERAKWQPPPHNPHPGSTVWIRGGRHPLLNPAKVVPTDLTVPEDVFMVLITGPNTGGKTVSLKTMGLMTLMAQSGLHLPANDAKLTIFNNVFADIGDEQSIEQSLSTFSAHVTNVIRILQQVDDKSLVLLDELGSGTDPGEGAALAQAIVNYLRDKGSTLFVATHYPELKVYASQTVGVTNASLLFDVDTLSPTYEMTIGLPGRSNAIAIARRLGLDEQILEDALQLLGTGNVRAESLLDSIYDIRDKISAQEAATRGLLRRVQQERDELRQRLENIERERAQVMVDARQQAEVELEQLREELRAVRKQLREGRGDNPLSLNALKSISRQIDQAEIQIANPPAESPKAPKKGQPPRKWLQVGDEVLIKTLGTRGAIVSLDNKEAMVAVGRLHTRVRLTDLELKERPEEKEEVEIVPAGTRTLSPSSSPGMELDLRGQRVEEGLAQLERYLDGAYLSRLPWVRIIHGMGTGRMKEAVRKALSKNRHVSSWEEGKDGEGGAGVTVAKFTSD